MLNEDLFRHIEQQKRALEQSLLNYDERSSLLKIEKQESLQLLIENLPKMNLAIPAANSTGKFKYLYDSYSDSYINRNNNEIGK